MVFVLFRPQLDLEHGPADNGPKTKQNIKAMDDKLQFSSSMKKFDEKAGLTEGVKKFSSTAQAQVAEIDKSLKISATTNAVVGIGKDAAGMAVNKAMENKIVSNATTTINESFTNASNKVKAVTAEAKATAKRDESQVVGDNSAAQANSNSQNIPEAEPAQ